MSLPCCTMGSLYIVRDWNLVEVKMLGTFLWSPPQALLSRRVCYPHPARAGEVVVGVPQRIARTCV